MKSEYTKNQLSASEQISHLKAEGLDFEDENKALHLFENISLFRLKSYLLPLRQPKSKTFKNGATLEDAYSLYKFDSELRKLICSELEKIEVSIRTQLSLVMGEYSGIYWFTNVDNFRDSAKHSFLLSNLKEELRRSDDEAILYFRQKYTNEFPPSWAAFEISSFGTLSMMYKWLKPGHARRRVAKFYGLSDTVMESWLHSIVYVRNICAHHSRLWNRNLSINALNPRQTGLPFISKSSNSKRVYYILAIIRYLLQSVNPQTTFTHRLRELLKKYPSVDENAMGFPTDWHKDDFWQ